MSKFSDKLEHYITNSGLVESQLALLTGYSRSYIARLKNGQRVSPDTGKMEKLFDALNLTISEYIELWDLYLEERLGKEKYDLTKACLDFISSFRYTSRLPVRASVQYHFPQVRMVEGRTDVAYLLRMMIEQEAAKPNGRLRLLMQPENGSVMEVLKSGFKINPKFQVEHMICLESHVEWEQYYNIRCLRSLVPVLLCQQEMSYDIYYYYDKVSAHYSSFSFMPYFLVTSEYVVNLDYGLEHAVVYREQELVGLYTGKFQELISRCAPLYRPIQGDKELLGHYVEAPLMQNEIFCIGNQPCMGVLEAEELFAKYALPPMQEEVLALQKRLKETRQRIERCEQRVVSYFTEEGLRGFLAEGRIEELPSRLYRPIELPDRVGMIRNLIRLAQKGLYEPHLVSRKKYQYPEGLIIDAYDLEHITLYYKDRNSEKRIAIQEKTLARLFYEFLECFRESTYVLSAEETVEYMKEVVSAGSSGGGA